MTRKAPEIRRSATIEELVPSFVLSLEARNRRPRTIEGYVDSVRLFVEWLHLRSRPKVGDLPHVRETPHDREGRSATSVREITKHDVEGFLADQVARLKPSTAATRYKGLRQFFRWCVEDDELDTSPMDGVGQPNVPEQPVPVLTADELTRLLKVCSGKAFEDRRDLAVISLLVDTGMRRGECAGLRLGDLKLLEKRVTVFGKGGRFRTVALGASSARAVDRYIRSRAAHNLADSPMLWLGSQGRTFTDQGIRQMLERRGLEAGVKVHAHQFRHTFAHLHLANGGLEGDLMELAGWRSRQMLTRYASSTASERARENYRSPLDRLTRPGERT